MLGAGWPSTVFHGPRRGTGLKPLLYLVTLAGIGATVLGAVGSVQGFGIFAWLLTLAGIFAAVFGFSTIKMVAAHRELNERERISSADRQLAEQLELARLHSSGEFRDAHAVEAAAAEKRRYTPRSRPRRSDDTLPPRRRRPPDASV